MGLENLKYIHKDKFDDHKRQSKSTVDSFSLEGNLVKISNDVSLFNNPVIKSLEKIKERTFDVTTLGKDQELGIGDYSLETLYNINHTAVTDRIQIDTGRKDHKGKAIEINTLRAGMGALGNLDIMGYSSDKLKNFRGLNRGDEPYIVQPIGSDRYATLTNRDTLPLHRAKDDTSRLLKFYESEAGKQSIFNENITNILIGNSLQPFRADTFLQRPFSNPIQGNTGFLNVTNDAFQDLGNIVGSLRKPLTI